MAPSSAPPQQRLAQLSGHWISSASPAPPPPSPPLPSPEEVHLIACDVDGTLLTTQHVMHPTTVEALKHIRRTRPDLPIVVSSGKQFKSCKNIRDELDLHPFPAAHAHGSVIYSHGTTILSNVVLPSASVIRLVHDLHSQNRAVFLFTETRCLFVCHEVGGKDWINIAGKYDMGVEDQVENRDAILQQVERGEMDIIKVTLCADAHNVDEHLRLLAAQYPEFGVTRAIPFILEIHDPATNKGTALQTICDRLSISPRNCLVFGDGENDIAMFRKAGYSVAMANGMEAAKRAATHHTVSNDEGGVGVFLDKIFR